MHNIISICLFQGKELLSSCSAGSMADVGALLEKRTDVHFIGKVKTCIARLSQGRRV